MTDNTHNDDHPSRIGPYKIVDVLGEGGMAIVYRARQTEPVKRDVALKILKLGMDTKQVVARFESERQALAVMDHPNIEKVFDGGETEAGRPYFVMELVHGVPVTEYCDTNKLTTEERLRLFIDICAAVQHAHHKGVIHRDIKPSNILVGAVGDKAQVKVIDFGIAKAVGAKLTDQTLVTRIGQFVGTPQYMSPEQAQLTGLDVDSRTDIYSLGVMLYQLLVGAPPLDLTSVSDEALPYALREQEPSKPSTRLTELGDTLDEVAATRRTDSLSLRRDLKGDLDWVVMKAMSKDRTRRYETANAFAMECERYLRHEPVLARPPSAGYVMARFMRRNRAAVLAAAVALLAILGGAAMATIGMLRAIEAEQVASREAETANQVSSFLVELFEVSDPGEARGNTITAREILDAGAERIEAELADQPAIQATLMQTMGRVYHKLGLYAEADELLERAVSSRRALEEDDLVIAEALQLRTELLVDQGRFDDAEALIDEAVELVEHDDGNLEALASVLNTRAYLYRHQARYDEAAATLSQALDLLEPTNADAQAQIADNLNRLAVIHRRQGDYEEAASLFERALSIRREVLGADHPAVASTMNSYAVLFIRTEDFDTAEELFLGALEIREKTLGVEHPDYAISLNNIGGFYSMTGQKDKALTVLERSLEVRRAALGPDHPSVGENMHNLAVVNNDLGNVAEALAWEAQALEIKKKTLEPGHPDIALSIHNYANILVDLERYDEAESLYLQVLDMEEQALGADHPNRLQTIKSYTDMLRKVGRHEDANTLAPSSGNP